MSEFHRIKSYIRYWLDAVNIHSLQAPFVYGFYKNALAKKPQEEKKYAAIEHIREKFKASPLTLRVHDLGAGSERAKDPVRRVADIASFGVTKRKYSQVMAQVIDYLDCKHIVELGTSLGINTLYLSLRPNARVTTFEGSEALVDMAKALFKDQRQDITVVAGNIDKTLPTFLERTNSLDFVYFDANHRYLPTIRYFDQCLAKSHDKTCFVFDDIHLSKEMEKAWQWIKSHYQVTLTLDLYQVGFVFINPELRKQHYVLEI